MASTFHLHAIPRPLRVLAVSCVTLLSVGQLPVTWAATVILKNGNTPLRGIVVSENEEQIVMRVTTPTGALVERTIARAEIDLLQRPVSVERLMALRPDEARGYREYAEELAEKRMDPEARETSLRLYLIAAYLEPERLGKSCLLGMTALARSQQEQRRFLAMAFLLDSDHDRSLLRADLKPASSDAAAPAADGSLRRDLLRALESLRKGYYHEALTLIRRPGVHEAMQAYGHHLPVEEFVAACEGQPRHGPPPSADLTRRVLRTELELLGSAATDSAQAGGRQKLTEWSELSTAALAQTAPELSLLTLTEFDPRQCLFREGRWQGQ